MDKKIVRIVLSDKEMTAIEALQDHFGITRLPDLFRFIIADKFRELKKDALKYGLRAPAPSKVLKELREDRYRLLLKMEPSEMTKELSLIGALQTEGVQPNSLTFKQYVGIDDTTGMKVLWYETKEGRFVATEPSLESILDAVKKDLTHYYPKSILQ